MVANNGHYAREQNPIVGAASRLKEDMWLQAKRWVRRFCALIFSLTGF